MGPGRPRPEKKNSMLCIREKKHVRRRVVEIGTANSYQALFGLEAHPLSKQVPGKSPCSTLTSTRRRSWSSAPVSQEYSLPVPISQEPTRSLEGIRVGGPTGFGVESLRTTYNGSRERMQEIEDGNSTMGKVKVCTHG